MNRTGDFAKKTENHVLISFSVKGESKGLKFSEKL